MKSPKIILLSLLIFLSFSVVKAQKTKVSPTPPVIEDEIIVCRYELVAINFSVWNRKGIDIRDLTSKDFEVYNKKEKQEVEFFQFDKLKNLYVIAFFADDFVENYNWKDLKIKIKLSQEKKKQYGKIFVKRDQKRFE